MGGTERARTGREGPRGLDSGSRPNIPVNSKVSQKGIHLRLAHGFRMADAVEEDESTAPVVVGVLGPPAEVADPAGMADAIEQFRLCGIWRRGRHGHLRGSEGVFGPAQIPAPRAAGLCRSLRRLPSRKALSQIKPTARFNLWRTRK